MKPKEAFEILRDTPIDIRSAREDDIHSLYATAQNMALDALQRQVWIPCSERLPEMCAEVLISTHVGVYIGEKTAGGYDICEEYWVSDKAVLAWMPLPEPYKVGDTE